MPATTRRATRQNEEAWLEFGLIKLRPIVLTRPMKANSMSCMKAAIDTLPVAITMEKYAGDKSLIIDFSPASRPKPREAVLGILRSAFGPTAIERESVPNGFRALVFAVAVEPNPAAKLRR